MYIDLERTDLSEHRTGICIVGAGAAGITIARRLLAAGLTVTLLESGGLDYEAGTADLNAGENVGEEYYPLDHARLRFFGGTSAIWGGRIAELDPIDFEKRQWVPWSGWPVSHQQMKPYYREARGLFGLPPEPPRTADMASAGVRLPDFDERELSLKLWSFDERFNRFTFPACKDLQDHPRCTLMTHATVSDIGTDREARHVRSLRVRSLTGRTLDVHADIVVLAAGGIENPRLLLASRSVMSQGLGNARDLVGRFFMEHPHARGGRIVASRAWNLLKAFGRKHRVRGQSAAALIAPSERRQSEAGILNTSLTVVPRQPAGDVLFWGMRAYNRVKHDMAPTKRGRAMWMYTKRAAALAQSTIDPLRPWLLHRMKRVDLALLVRAEQAPNPDSRVLLSGESDALGVPRVKLDWRMSELDVHSVERLVDTLGREIERLGIGKVEPASWLSDSGRRWQTDPLISSHALGGYHHMGTTRMADDPKRGVTDQHGRVHGIANLYIAGSSLFPTSGWANPTLTIAALALRTADHIALQIDKRQAPELSTERAYAFA